MGQLENLIEAVERGDLADVTGILEVHPELVHERDESGATALHYAAFGGHRPIVEQLVKQGADLNATDGRFGATPTGWAIEYLREMGGFLGIELSDLAHAIQRGETEWVARFLHRFPALRSARDTQGKAFKVLAEQSGNQEIAKLFQP
jgi:ankyrin repeat protein